MSPQKANSLLLIALDAAADLLYDGCKEVQEKFISLPQSKQEYEKFYATLCKHMKQYAHDIETRERLLEKFVDSERIKQQGQGTMYVDSHNQEQNDVQNMQDLDNTDSHLPKEDGQKQQLMAELIAFEKRMLHDPDKRDSVPGNNELIEKIARVVTFMCLNMNPELQDMLRGRHTLGAGHNVIQELVYCLEKIAKDIEILGLHQVRVVLMLLEACRAVMQGPNSAIQKYMRDHGLFQFCVKILCRNRDRFDGKLQEAKKKGHVVKDRQVTEGDGRDPVAFVMQSVLQLRNTAVQVLLAAIEEDIDCELTRALLDSPEHTYSMYADVLYDISLSLNITFEELSSPPFKSMEGLLDEKIFSDNHGFPILSDSRRSEEQVVETGRSIRESFRTYGINTLILLKKVIDANKQIQQFSQQFMHVGKPKRNIREKEMQRLVDLFERFTTDEKVLKIFLHPITVIQLKNGEKAMTTLMFETPNRNEYLKKDYAKEKHDCLQQFKKSPGNHLQVLTAFVEHFETVDIELRLLETIDPVSRQIVRYSQAFTSFSTMMTAGINTVLIFYAAGHRLSSESTSDDEHSVLYYNLPHNVLFIMSIAQLVSLSFKLYAFLRRKVPALVGDAERENESRDRHIHLYDTGDVSVLGITKSKWRNPLRKRKPIKRLSTLQKMTIVLTNSECLFTVVTAILAVLSLFEPFASVFLLICMLLRFQATSELILHLARVVLRVAGITVGLICLAYIWSFAVFMYRNAEMLYDGDIVCDKLIKCATTTLWRGMTAAGGIGDLMVHTLYEGDGNKARSDAIFNIFFFFAVLITLQAAYVTLLMSCASDAETKRRRSSALVHERCFVCGMERREFESTQKFKEHTKGICDPWRYMTLRMYLQEKLANSRNSLTGIEKHAAQEMMLMPKDFCEGRSADSAKGRINVINFMPIQAQVNTVWKFNAPSPITSTLGGLGITLLQEAIHKHVETIGKWHVMQT